MGMHRGPSQEKCPHLVGTWARAVSRLASARTRACAPRTALSDGVLGAVQLARRADRSRLL